MTAGKRVGWWPRTGAPALVFLLPGSALLLFQVPWGLRNAHLYRQSAGEGLGFFWSMISIGLGLALITVGVLFWVKHANGTADGHRQRRLALVIGALALLAVPAGIYAESLGTSCFAGCGPWFSPTLEARMPPSQVPPVQPLEPLPTGNGPAVEPIPLETLPVLPS